MSINIDLGAWNSIFAVPSKVVDEGLKFSDGVKLKVLLFVLRNAGRSVDDTEISKATGVNVTDIPEALDYWVSIGVFNRIENTFTPVKNNEEFVSAPQTSVQTDTAACSECFTVTTGSVTACSSGSRACKAGNRTVTEGKHRRTAKTFYGYKTAKAGFCIYGTKACG